MRRRSLQIASNIQRELQQRLARGLNDPRVRGLVTVTKVELSDDLKHAKAYISVMPEDRASLTMHGLTAATKRLRRDVMDRIHLKEMPTLRLVYDHGHKAETQVFSLLEQDRREQESKNSSGWSSPGKIEDGSQADSGLESSEDPIA
ncbi:MAG: 30S ribosome-binding factor RbfA [Phycisphaerales bacterium]